MMMKGDEKSTSISSFAEAKKAYGHGKNCMCVVVIRDGQVCINLDIIFSKIGKRMCKGSGSGNNDTEKRIDCVKRSC